MIYLLRVDVMTLIKYVMRKFYAGVCLYPNIYIGNLQINHISFSQFNTQILTLLQI